MYYLYLLSHLSERMDSFTHDKVFHIIKAIVEHPFPSPFVGGWFQRKVAMSFYYCKLQCQKLRDYKRLNLALLKHGLATSYSCHRCYIQVGELEESIPDDVPELCLCHTLTILHLADNIAENAKKVKHTDKMLASQNDSKTQTIEIDILGSATPPFLSKCVPSHFIT